MNTEELLASYHAYRADTGIVDYATFYLEDDMGNRVRSFVPLKTFDDEELGELEGLKELEKDEFEDELLAANRPVLQSILEGRFASLNTEGLRLLDYDLNPVHLYTFKLALFTNEKDVKYANVDVHMDDADYEKLIVWRYNQLDCGINFQSVLFAYPDLYKYLVKQFQDQIVDAVPHVENVPYAVFMDELEEDFQSMTMRTFQIGDRIPFDFCGPDFSSTDQGTVIYRDTDHIFVQFTYMSPFAAYELNREGIPYEKVREIIGKDIPHNQDDRFVDMLDINTLRVTNIPYD